MVWAWPACGLKKYEDAIGAYVKCRDLYRSMAGKQFANRQDAQRYRQDRLTEIDDVIRQYQTGPQTASTQDRLRQLNSSDGTYRSTSRGATT